MAAAREQLEQLGRAPDGALDAFAGALALAAWAEPDFDPGPYLRHGAQLKHDILAYVRDDDATAELSAEAARQVLNRRFGYIGATDPAEQGDGANIARVIDKRRGSALALSILYVHALSGLAVGAEVLDFPARALVRIEDQAGARLMLDPFEGGRVADARQLRALYRAHRGGGGEISPFDLNVLGARAQLVALQDDVKVHHLRHAAPEAALAALEAALLVDPANPRLWREAGLLNARLEHIGAAISALERFLDLPGGDAHRYTASQLLQQLRQRQDKDQT